MNIKSDLLYMSVFLCIHELVEIGLLSQFTGMYFVWF